MFAIPLSAYGFGIATMDDPSTFAIVWMVAIGLIAAILMLAGLDAINTMRLHRHAKHGLRSEFRQALRLTKPLFDDENEHENENENVHE